MRQLTWMMFAALGMVLSVATISRAEEGQGHETHIKIPKAVAKALREKFPEAEIRGISKEKNEKGKTTYEFNLVIHTKVDVEFEEDGELEAVERQIAAFEVPETIRKVAAKQGKIVKAETVTDDDGELKYELQVEGEGKATELVYSPGGKLLKTEAKTGEKEGEKHAKQHKGDKRAKAKKHEKAEAHEKGKLKKHKHEEEEEDDKSQAKKHEQKEEHDTGKLTKHNKEKEEEEDDDEHERPKSK